MKAAAFGFQVCCFIMQTDFLFKRTALIRYSSIQCHNFTEQQNYMMIAIKWPETWKDIIRNFWKKMQKRKNKTAITLLSFHQHKLNIRILAWACMWCMNWATNPRFQSKQKVPTTTKTNAPTSEPNQTIKNETGDFSSWSYFDNLNGQAMQKSFLFKARNLLWNFNLWTKTKWASNCPRWTCKAKADIKDHSFDAKNTSKATWNSQIWVCKVPITHINAWKA